MSDARIDVDFILNNQEVKAKSEDIKRSITGADQTAETSAKKASEVIQRAYNQSTKGVNEYSRAVRASNAEMANQTRRIGRQTSTWNGLNHSINQLTRELPAFQVSAQVGFLALSNNIPILADEIKNLRAQNEALIASGQKGIPIWKRVISGILSPMTALSLAVTAITLYGKEIGEFFSKIFKGEKAFDALKTRVSSLNAALKSSEYKEALTDLKQLEINIALANQGYLDADKVVKQYNDTLGDTIGHVTTLAEAEQSLIDKGDAFIQMTLYKAAAIQSMDKYAEELVNKTEQKNALQKELKELEQQADILYAGELNKPFFEQERKRKGISKDQAKQDFIQSSDIKQQIEAVKASIAALESEGTSVAAELQQKAAEIAKANGLNILGSGKSSESNTTLISQRQALLDRIAALDREYARKQLDTNEAEVQALKDKFVRMRELIVEFNAKVKNEQKIDLVQVNQLEDKLVSDLKNHQRKEQLEKDREQFEKQLKQLKDYEAVRFEMIEEYQVLREKLISEGYEREAQELDRKHAQELEALDDGMIRQMSAYRKLFAGIETLSRAQAKIVIAEAERMVRELESAGRISADMAKKILKEIGSAQKGLDDRNWKDLSDLATSLHGIGRLVNEVDGDFGDVLMTMGEMIHAAVQFRDAIDVVSNLDAAASALTTLAAGLNAALGAIGLILTIVSFIQRMNEENKKMEQARRDFIHGIEDGERRINELYRERAQLAAEIEGATLRSLENEKEQAQASLAQIQAEIQEIMDFYNSSGLLPGDIEMMNELLTSSNKNDREFGKTWRDWNLDTMYQTDLVEVNTNNPFRPTVTIGLHDTLAGKSFEELEQIFEKGLMTERAAELFEQLRDLVEQGYEYEQILKDINEELKSIYTGGATANAIADTIIEGFRQGKRTVEDFADDVEDLLRNALLSGFKFKVLEEPLNELIDSMYGYITDGGGLGDKEVQIIKGQYDLILQNAHALFEALSEESGLDLLSELTDSSLQGGIQRSITEETASELAGLYRAQFDVTKEQLILTEHRFSLDQQTHTATLEIVASNAAIEKNTKDTANRLSEAIELLTQISSNTQQTTNAGYNRGI